MYQIPAANDPWQPIISSARITEMESEKSIYCWIMSVISVVSTSDKSFS